ncbi:MAG: hypothetical protein QM682_05035 [Paracoccus sp. (in: a-proteobacteria)]|uniref:hypothetical protein n=1 Tax=Paracoccus sp. TaxID=267 RepID=UPI0039E5074D
MSARLGWPMKTFSSMKLGGLGHSECGRDRSKMQAKNYHQPTWERIAVFISGLVMIGALIWIAIIVPNPTDFQYTVFRIVLGISGAALAALIPGFIDLRYKNVIRAGGAMAVLVIIYFFPVASPTSSSSANGDCNVIGESRNNNINCNNN